MKKLNVGVVGATGMVGKVFMDLLVQRNFPYENLRLFTSEYSDGKKIRVKDKDWVCETLKPGCFEGLDLVFFSSGDPISKEWAPQAVKAGAYAVDNSAAFRMDPTVALVVPEVNAKLLQKNKPQIIANPNCSTIQLVVVLKYLQDHFGLSEVRVSSYQSVSGAGQAGYDELQEQAKKITNGDQNLSAKTFPHPIAFNLIPEIGSWNADGYCSEEMKIMNETRKILDLPKLRVSAFTVRVPVMVAHSETVWVTLQKDVNRDELLNSLQNKDGVVVQDDPTKSIYPTPAKVAGSDPVYVGRIHKDLNDPKTWLMWVVSDNVRKGAALNGIQIAERLFDIAP